MHLDIKFIKTDFNGCHLKDFVVQCYHLLMKEAGQAAETPACAQHTVIPGPCNGLMVQV